VIKDRSALPVKEERLEMPVLLAAWVLRDFLETGAQLDLPDLLEFSGSPETMVHRVQMVQPDKKERRVL
jgi:hypothetical protein